MYENHYLKLYCKPVTLPPANDILQEGALLHGTPYSRVNFESILKEGLISPDLGKSLREAKHDKRSIGGIDTFAVAKKQTIKQYFDWLATDTGNSPLKNERCFWRDENGFVDLTDPNGPVKRKSLVFVVNPKHPDLKPIMDYKTPALTLPDGAPNPEYKGLFTLKTTEGTPPGHTPRGPNHHWVPVGIPSGYFEKIIVGADITPEQVSEMKELIKKYNLNAKVFNTKGEVL